MLGGMGRIVCRTVVFLFINLLFKFALLLVPCLSIWKVGGGKGLYETKARNLTLLEQWDQRLAGGKNLNS